ncbi:MAG: tyrosine phosphatase family protein [Caulobacterales bacterium]|jgi:predicted protein tyrosine phosphatase
MAIVVCALSRVPKMLEAHKPVKLISLLDPDTPFPVPQAHKPARHLQVKMHDIANDLPGHTAPNGDIARDIIAFVSAWRRDAPLLVHCYAGISRSTATAFISACLHNPNTDEEEIAQAIRAASPTATPNERLVAMADAELGRGGRMSRAVARIGRGFPTWPAIDEAEPFSIPSRF